MNKNELNRLVAWRLKLLREADEMPRGVAQTCRHYGLSRAVVSKILYLRERYRFGVGRIASYLHRFHNRLLARKASAGVSPKS
jgi:hypothetical protein